MVQNLEWITILKEAKCGRYQRGNICETVLEKTKSPFLVLWVNPKSKKKKE